MNPGPDGWVVVVKYPGSVRWRIPNTSVWLKYPDALEYIHYLRDAARHDRIGPYPTFRLVPIEVPR